MNKIKDFIFNISLQHPERYKKLIFWDFLDTYVATIPYAIIIFAMFVFLEPLIDETKTLDIKMLVIYSVILMIQAVVYWVVRKKSYTTNNHTVADNIAKSRKELGDKLHKLPMNYFFKRDTGDLTSVMMRDYTTVNESAVQILNVVTCFARLILAIVAFTIIDYRMAIALLISIPLSIPFVFLGKKYINKHNDALIEAQQNSYTHTLEFLDGMQTLRAFNKGGENFTVLRNTFDELRSHSIKIEAAFAPISVISRFVLNSGIGITIGVGAYYFLNGELTPTVYIGFIVIATQMYSPLMLIYYFLSDIERIRKSSNRIKEVFDEEVNSENANKSTNSSDITFENVRFSYGKNEVLKGINLKVEPNTITALVGLSGSGKTTITRLIARFWKVNEGEVKIGGVNVKDLAAENLQNLVSIVFQDVYLFNDTIRNNITMGKDGVSDHDIFEICKKACCYDFIKGLPNGLDTMVGEGGNTLSGGEKQRISIARALIKDAPIVMLDEATSSLDTENEFFIQQALSELVKDKTVIVIAHRLHSIANADNILVLDNGEIVQEGNHVELMAQEGIYKNLYEQQQLSSSWQIV